MKSINEQYTSLEKTNNSYGLEEVDDIGSKIEDDTTVNVKNKGDIYYQMYGDAKRRATMLKDMALSAYLEVKEIKQKYNLDDSDDNDYNSDTQDSDEEYGILEKL